MKYFLFIKSVHGNVWGWQRHTTGGHENSFNYLESEQVIWPENRAKNLRMVRDSEQKKYFFSLTE